MYAQKTASRRSSLPLTDRLLPKLIILLTMHSLSWADSDSPVFHLPIDCQIGTQCFIQNYVDADPSADYHDYTCGFLSYQSHRGTDFRIPDLTTMEHGIRVIAAAAGTVRATRNRMPDVSVKEPGSPSVKGREAGNSVAIQHGNGWETQYSHLRRGSVLVKPGDHVTQGQPLGMVGLSGNTEFPHLHFSVRHHGKIIDPFTGIELGKGECNEKPAPLWDAATDEKLKYTATGIVKLSFDNQLPARKPYYKYMNTRTTLPEDTDRIIFWSLVFGVHEGDKLSMQIISPSAEILANNGQTISANQAQRFNMIGKRRNQSSWPTGTYKGTYILQRPVNNQYKTILSKTINLQIISSH